MEEILSSGVGRPKMWKELSVEEQLERLREQIKLAHSSASSFSPRIWQLEDTLHHHVHDQSGEVMVKVKNSRSYGEASSDKSLTSLKDEREGNVYF